MTASVQQDALLGKFAVLAYSDEDTVKNALATNPYFSGWKVHDSSIVGAFAAYAFKNEATGKGVKGARVDLISPPP